MAAGCALFLYVSYAMPIAAGFVAEGKTWTEFGPFRLGIWSKPIAVLALIGVLFVVYAGIQPPFDILINYAVGLLVLLLVIWFGFERRRFQGPPIGDDDRQAPGRDPGRREAPSAKRRDRAATARFASPRLRGEGSAFGRTSGAKRSGGEGAVPEEAPCRAAAPSSSPPPHPRLLRRLAAFGSPLPASGERRIRCFLTASRRNHEV